MENNNTPPAPVTPAPVTPETPAAPVVPQVTIEDLFGAPATPATPAPVAPVTPAVPATPNLDEMTPEERKFHESVQQTTQQQIQDATKKFETTVENTTQNVTKTVERQTELVQFFNSDKGKHFQPYMKEITKVATDPRYINFNLDRVIPFTLGTDVMMHVTGKIAESANSDAAASSTGGNSNGGQTEKQPVDYFAMSDEEFKATQNAVRTGAYKAK